MLAQEIYQAARESGFDNCGIISPEALIDSERYLQERIANVPSSAGFYGGLRHYQSVTERFPWAKSIIVCTAEYGRYRYPAEMRGRYGKAFFLSPEEGRKDGYDQGQFEAWMTANGIRWGGINAVPVRYAAMKAGLGIIRKNNFFYTENGSYVGLISYIADCECTLIHQPSIKPCADHCNLCRRACKSGSLSAPYTMDPMKCVSFWTTFGKGKVPPFLNEAMFEEWICGCDNCQDACPYNRQKNWDEGEPFSNLEEIGAMLSPEKLLEQNDDFLKTEVIAKTDHHLAPEDTDVLRRCAKRALQYRQEKSDT